MAATTKSRSHGMSQASEKHASRSGDQRGAAKGMGAVPLIALCGLALAAAVMRLVPHPPNFTPMAALALFCGAQLGRRPAAFWIPLAAMLISDLYLGFFVYGFGLFHAQMPLIYVSFALIALLGTINYRRIEPVRVGVTVLAGSLLFFWLSNLGVWLTGTMYPKNLAGLATCYVAAIPYYRNMLMGDLFYAYVFFGGWAFAQQFVAAAQQSAPAVRERT
jgi:hypothetical protein